MIGMDSKLGSDVREQMLKGNELPSDLTV